MRGSACCLHLPLEGQIKAVLRWASLRTIMALANTFLYYDMNYYIAYANFLIQVYQGVSRPRSHILCTCCCCGVYACSATALYIYVMLPKP